MHYASAMVETTAAVVGIQEGRLKAQRTIEIPQGTLQVAKFAANACAVAIGLREARIERTLPIAQGYIPRPLTPLPRRCI